MSYAIKRDRRTLWREAATPEELTRIEQIDREVSELEDRRAALVVERLRICNRACQRARYNTMEIADAR